MEIVQEHAVFKNKKYYLDLNEKSISINKAAFHELKGRYYQKKNYWVFPGDIMDKKDTKESTKTENIFEVLETDTVTSMNCSIASKSETPSVAASKGESVASKSVTSKSVSNSIASKNGSVFSKSVSSKSKSIASKSVTSKTDSLQSNSLSSKNGSVASKSVPSKSQSVENNKTPSEPNSEKSSLKIEKLPDNPITVFNHSYKINPPSVFLENVSTYLV